ncbi:L-glutamate gamma-semialdehyde dehydrogenase [Nocardia terpenica]|uniref:L-glutamate gamma-semialdehyde dehydrogenase n=1 Tax=Nocardia terpenica TaxID=455432 RepID=UPI00189600C0|nr:L-glutamate gamma-semialdehyde dehydrogenase [Nocardia terpenica]MBF6060841.1 L-glutamate gamma-semialdehyde dehydrogenase [Nocardia terpenica]MBF6104101.1 L-glutamate gamma-semialdehyde dehydrogenase [Nocardia terpenica]MBF6111525.1 L-glutamate gamma-semialdehyde dehydrogenase [Nocardia terpenica]MBF6118322.1 L-glutamate gamma-semialdehyde dehydrogenase [Nocardia terpenica]MBF6155644.1 L-glutamate gamma-semialdehyde dehydrogenase [Nocardia terpenica]
MDAVTVVPTPRNEPVHSYAPGSPERGLLVARLAEMSGAVVDVPLVIGGKHRAGVGARGDIVMPHRYRHVLGTYTDATHEEGRAAVEAAVAAGPGWRELPFEERAAVLLRAADLLAGSWRETVAAATMLGQSKSAYQAEIDAPCELIDFWRFNVAFARHILAQQPESGAGVWNRMDYRPLEGFVYAITPFNFSAIAGNLPTAPALMGNTVVWKPSPTQTLAAYHTMRLLEQAGLPPGVINLVTGDGRELSEVVLADPRLAGIHFTGSTRTFQYLWQQVGANLPHYHGYPRLVGETGGKDFIVAHASADPDALRTALIRGAYEYQGQKCSAASRAYIPESLWRTMGDDLLAQTAELTYGDVADLSNFGGALIDRRAYDKNVAALERARSAGLDIPVGGTYDDGEGYFVRPTVLLADDPRDEAFATEYFGPILAVHVYDDADPDAFDTLLREVDTAAPYALTGAVFARDRTAVDRACAALRFTAGNFYINDKPTGAVVGQQPFGGARASGTDDKAGSYLNLLRWVAPRTLKETFAPPTDYRYPHMER